MTNTTSQAKRDSAAFKSIAIKKVTLWGTSYWMKPTGWTRAGTATYVGRLGLNTLLDKIGFAQERAEREARRAALKPCEACGYLHETLDADGLCPYCSKDQATREAAIAADYAGEAAAAKAEG